MIHYLLQSTLFWGLCALLYRAVLRRETFFAANRAFLLLALAGGMVYPLLAGWLAAQTGLGTSFSAILPEMVVGAPTGKSSFSSGWWGPCAWVLYGIGVVWMLLRTTLGWLELRRLAREADVAEYNDEDGTRVVYSAAVQEPMSFFSTVYLPLHLYDTPLEQLPILHHERVHVRQGHSFDVLLLEIISAFFWFHPLVHWYRRALRQVHEYLADEGAARSTSRKQYGYLLLQQALSGPAPALAHAFFQSPLKQRLLMLTQQKSPRWRALNYLLILPVLLLALLACNKDIIPQEPSGGPVKELSDIDQLPVFPGGEKAMMQYLMGNIHYPENAKKDKVEEVVALSFVIRTDGSISDVKNLKSTSHPELVAEAIRVVEAMPNWTPGEKNHKKVNVRYTLPIRFRLN